MKKKPEPEPEPIKVPEPGPADEISVNRSGETFGPYLLPEVKDYLKSGNLRFSDMVWFQGLPEWVPLSSVPGISDGIKGLAAPPPPPPPPKPPPTPPLLTSPVVAPTKPAREELEFEPLTVVQAEFAERKGSFSKWLEDEMPFARKTACHYIKIAKNVIAGLIKLGKTFSRYVTTILDRLRAAKKATPRTRKPPPVSEEYRKENVRPKKAAPAKKAAGQRDPPWGGEDDLALAKAYVDGVETGRLANKFGRTETFIRSRIKTVCLADGTRGYASTSVLAKSRGWDRDALFTNLEKEGYLARYDEKWFLTIKGYEKGGRFMTRGTRWFFVVWPENSLSEVSAPSQQKKPSLRKVVGKKFVKDDEFPGFYLNGYIPYRTGEQDVFSKDILKLKKKQKTAIAKFLGKLKALKACEFAVCAVPGHDSVSSNYSSGIRKLAKELGKLPGVTDLSGNLLRKREIPKKSGGGKRDLATDLKSLKLKNSASFRGKEILLLDDVATTWTTMKACRMTIEKVGPKDVVPFVLGRTISS